MAGVTVDDALVRALAALARLPLADDEVAGARAHLERLLGYVARLEAVDARHVPPDGPSLGDPGPLRDDVPQPSLPRADLLAGAPAHDGTFFLVPQVIADADVDADG